MMGHQKEKKEISSQVSDSGINSSVITSNGSGSIIDIGLFSNVIFRSERLGSLVSCHLRVHHLKVQALQVNSSGMLDEIMPQKLEAFEVPTEEYSVVLVGLLKALNRSGSNGLKLLLGY